MPFSITSIVPATQHHCTSSITPVVAHMAYTCAARTPALHHLNDSFRPNAHLQFAIHRATHHQPPQPTPPQPSQETTPADIATANILMKSTRNTQSHWEHGINVIEATYDHEPPDFRTSWRHMLCGRQESSFLTLQSLILCCIVIATTTTESTNDAAPF